MFSLHSIPFECEAVNIYAHVYTNTGMDIKFDTRLLNT